MIMVVVYLLYIVLSSSVQINFSVTFDVIREFRICQ